MMRYTYSVYSHKHAHPPRTLQSYMDMNSAGADCRLKLCKYVIVDASVWCPKIVLSLGSPGRMVLMVRVWVDSELSGST